jgi:hypothetical protein
VHPLDGVNLKIARADEHFDLLDSEIVKWLNAQEYRVSEYDSTHTGESSRSLVEPPETPDRWSLIVGEYAYNMRSALDHLAWQLALLNTQGAAKARAKGDPWPPERMEFPVYAYFRKSSQKKRYQEKLRRFSPPHRTIVDQEQPFQRGNAASADALWLLQELRNTDAHRVLNTTAVFPPPRESPAEIGEPLNEEAQPPSGIVLGGGVEGTLEYTAKDDFAAYIAFDEPRAVFHQREVLPLLSNVRDRVKGVIARFDRVFP